MFFHIGSVLFLWAILANKPTTCFSMKIFFPCVNSARYGAYQEFLNKHVRQDTPETLDQNQWQAFIRQIGTCNRPIQSFIPYALKQQVDNICSPSGGKAYGNNLCVSKGKFDFTTVYVDNNCVVRSVVPEKKYLLLACNKVQNLCRPVHFEPNPHDDGPEDENPDCKNLNSQYQTPLYIFKF